MSGARRPGLAAGVAAGLAAVLSLAAAGPAPRARPARHLRAEVDALAEGRACTELLYAGDTAALWERLGDALRELFGEPEKLAAFRLVVGDQLGEEEELLDEEVVDEGALRVYVRRARFAKLERPVRVTFAFSPTGRVEGFRVAPEAVAAPSEHLDYETRTPLRLPFAAGDAWTVFWGGREIEQNYHAAYLDQRFAYDFLMARDGTTHAGEGARNEDYFCFDRPVVAPGAGVVVAAGDGVPDNVPGEMNPRQPLGNHVVIDHGNGEFSFLAHFRRGTVAVEEGQRVEAGAPLGRCGNSGNSSEPHLHYHLQDAPEFQQGGRGLPSFFLDYRADGQPVARGEPVRGQVVEVPESGAETPPGGASEGR